MFFWQRSQPQHTIDYLVLIITMTIIAVFVRLVQNSDLTLLAASILASTVYVIWGVIHHKKSGHIDKKIFLEYLGFAISANVLILILLL
jgi:hypothetical protein